MPRSRPQRNAPEFIANWFAWLGLTIGTAWNPHAKGQALYADPTVRLEGASPPLRFTAFAQSLTHAIRETEASGPAMTMTR